MVRHRNDAMGRFSVDVKLANFADVARMQSGDIPPESVRRATARAVVDSGATQLVLPERLVEELGLRREGQSGVRFADGRTAVRDIATGVSLAYAGRSGLFNAIVEPGRDDALLGAIVMEALDLVVDCTHQTLVPRDPERIISEIE